MKNINQTYCFKQTGRIMIGLFVLVCSSSWIHAQNVVPEASLLNRENDLIITGTPKTSIQRQLWEARIGASTKSEPSVFQKELESIIQQVSSIQIEPKVQPAAPVSDSDVLTNANPVKEPSGSNNAQKQPVGISLNNFVSEETLEQFKKISEDPGSLIAPLKLADIFFKSHCFDEAAICYQEAFNRIAGKQSDDVPEKAWILFQLGNCLEKKSPEASLEKFELVIAEYPYSQWAKLAKGKIDLISWYLKDQPKTLMQEFKLESDE